VFCGFRAVCIEFRPIFIQVTGEDFNSKNSFWGYDPVKPPKYANGVPSGEGFQVSVPWLKKGSKA